MVWSMLAGWSVVWLLMVRRVFMLLQSLELSFDVVFQPRLGGESMSDDFVLCILNGVIYQSKGVVKDVLRGLLCSSPLFLCAIKDVVSSAWNLPKSMLQRSLFLLKRALGFDGQILEDYLIG